MLSEFNKKFVAYHHKDNDDESQTKPTKANIFNISNVVYDSTDIA